MNKSYENVITLMDTATVATKRMRDAIQTALVAMIEHVDAHDNDTSIIINQGKAWVNGLSGANKTALVEYLCKFGGVRIEAQDFKNNKKQVADVAGAKACNWYDLKADNPFQGFSLNVKLKALLAQASAAMQEDDQSKVYIAPKLIAQLQTMHTQAEAFTNAMKEDNKRKSESMDNGMQEGVIITPQAASEAAMLEQQDPLTELAA